MELREEIVKLRSSADMAQTRSLAAGLVFLRYVCAAFEELRSKLVARPPSRPRPGSRGIENPVDPELPNTYREAGVFFVPESARWDRIFPAPGTAPADAGTDAVAPLVAGAIRAIEGENPALRDVFPGLLARRAPRRAGPPPPPIPATLARLLGGLSAAGAAEAFGFVVKECAKMAEFDPPVHAAASPPPVPAIITELLAGMLEPYTGRFCDPCCGGGEILTGVVDFIAQRQGKLSDLSFYAQERDAESLRLARMGLLVRGVDASQIRWNADSPLQRDLHGDLKFDFLAACPSFKENAYPWIQYILARLSPAGLGALVLPKSSLNSPGEDERHIRRTLVESRLVDCVVSLPARLFPGFPGSLCVWFLSHAKTSRGRRADEALFINAQDMGKALSRREWELSGEDIGRIARTYHNWRFPKASPYRDTRLFSVSASTARIREAGYNLNPALYLGLPETGDDFGPEDRFSRLRAEFEALVKEEPRVSRGVVESLRKIKLGD
jgi:type I restriction enzyme M protein